MKEYIKPVIESITIEAIMLSAESKETAGCLPYSNSATQLSKDNEDDDWDEEY